MMNRRVFLEALPALALYAQSGSGLGVLLPHSESSNATKLAAPDQPLLIPVPTTIRGVQQPVIDLGGEWSLAIDPPDEFWKRNVDTMKWKTVHVPGEFTMQGFDIVQDREYPCRTKISIPADYSGQRIFLRFDGVYGYARVWINGVYLRDHFGGFTSWDCEITDHVKPGGASDLLVGVTDRSDDISQASYYAKHLIGGILRRVRLFAAPANCLTAFSASATPDSKYKDGLLRVRAQVPPVARPVELHLELKDASGQNVSLEPAHLVAGPDQLVNGDIHVPLPKLWDAEHPNLYELWVSVRQDGEEIETFRRQIGFRTVQCKNNQLLVNGHPVKLRGACRHSTHPLYGRAVPAEFDEQDAVLFREANINFVRTSHYPPTEEFLEACDHHGIYVEEETAVCWSKVDGGPSSDPAFSSRFVSQFQEMIQRDQDHAAILFWSLGNESQWGSNLAREYRYAREENPDRPLIFSFPDTVPVGTGAYDIYSKHYPDVAADLGSELFPVLNDEYAHIPCYNVDTLRRDPGVRNFWGESIKRFGERMLSADGCLGGSIWAGIDDIFFMPGGPVGYGPWGIIDGWRRPKPEYWLAKKAYSPIRINDSPLANPGSRNGLTIPISNAFDHTNLKEVEIEWKVGVDSGHFREVDIAPHGAGYLAIPERSWREGDVVELRFLNANHKLIDEFHLRIGDESQKLPSLPRASASLTQAGDEILVEGKNLLVSVSRETGLVNRAVLDGHTLLEGGPFVDLGAGPLASNWMLRKCSALVRGGAVVIHTAGECKQGEGIETIPIEFEMEIGGAGGITTRYRSSAPSTDGSHLGIAYLLPAGMDQLRWKRKAIWSVYPEDHIGRPEGVASLRADHPVAAYRSRPQWPWQEDTKDFFLSGKNARSFGATNDFRSLKENIWYAACSAKGSNYRVRAEADADLAVRVSVQPTGRLVFSLFNFWSYPNLDWGNYTGSGRRPTTAMHEVRLRLTDQPEV